MTCREIEERGLAEEYLAGRLGAAERDAYEAHYFECDRCYGELATLRAVRDALVSAPTTTRSGVRHWLPLAAALVIAGTAAAWVLGRGGPDRTADPVARIEAPSERSAPTTATRPDRAAVIQQLARVDAPRAPSVLRGSTPPTLSEALEEYRAGRYERAVPLFESALRTAPSDQIRFYLGVSALLANDADTALPPLTKVAADRESAYAEEAQFLLAKAHLQREDLPAAIEALEATAAMRGERAAEARRLRDEIQKLQ